MAGETRQLNILVSQELYDLIDQAVEVYNREQMLRLTRNAWAEKVLVAAARGQVERMNDSGNDRSDGRDTG